MIIVGAKGFAKEVLEILHQRNEVEDLFFYDDISNDAPKFLFDRFKVLRSKKEAIDIFKNNSKKFTLGIGNPVLRHSLAKKFREWGGEFDSTISPNAHIGHYGNTIGPGVNIMTGTIITNDINLGEGALINLNCTIGHETVIGKYSELSPGIHISGRCTIGNFCNIGTGAVLLPDISLGQNVTVGAGSVVTKNIVDNSVVVGIPGRIIKKLDKLRI